MGEQAAIATNVEIPVIVFQHLRFSTGQRCNGTRRALVGLAVLGAASLTATSRVQAADDFSAMPVMAHLQSAQFRIPFNIESSPGSDSFKVQLWVSADEGITWQTHGSVSADAKSFDFRAAAEGVYLFKVATVDAAGQTFPSLGQPLKVLVDTSKPQAELRADINEQGQLVVEVRVFDLNLDSATATLRIRSDHETQWRELPVDALESAGQTYEGQFVADIAPCREIAIAFTVKDQAQNEGEATFLLRMPRTAGADQEMTLASNSSPAAKPTEAPNALSPPRLVSTPGATRWTPTAPTSLVPPPNSTTPIVSLNSTATALSPPSAGGKLNQPLTSALGHAASGNAGPNLMETSRTAIGRLAADSQLSLDPIETTPIETTPVETTPIETTPFETARVEELPLPAAIDVEQFVATGKVDHEQAAEASPPATTDTIPSTKTQGFESTIARAFHCKSRAFSLDYSVQALGGSALADVELWGTEDGGRTWQKWGSDPDRVSPFDVQVGNDGMFGFRMVIVGVNGLVSNRPREGDNADVWINVDTSPPTARITRAVYGEGPDDGLLVIDYSCDDGHLSDRPIALLQSERADGPWTAIASGLANTGIYLWKADPLLPEKVYLKIECVDKSGNIGSHRLDLPIDIKGLAPRGVIQGFRPIEIPGK